jgi:hypothetical protein
MDQKQPDERTAALMDKAARQAVKVLTSEEAAISVARDAKTRGPAPAIADALNQVVEGITAAADGAGVMLPLEVVDGVKEAMAQLLVAMMVGSGLAQDPDALMQELQPLLADEPEPAEGAPTGEPPMQEPMQAPPGGSLAMARGGM